MSAGRVLLAVTAAAMLGACSDNTGLRAGADVDVVFVSGQQLYTLRSGSQPIVTALGEALPFAATNRAVALFPIRRFGPGQSAYGDLQLFHLQGTLDSLGVPGEFLRSVGAISPDGASLVYVRSGADGHIYLKTVHLLTGLRDSSDVSIDRAAPAAIQIAGNAPVFSPSGDSVAFLLPNPITVQLFIYEVRTRRVQVYPVPVPVTTFVQLLAGWPRWTRENGIRFLGRRIALTQLLDSVIVMSVDPRTPTRFAQQLYTVGIPDSLPITDFGVYSFDQTGDAVVFGMNTNGVNGLFLARRDSPKLRTILYNPAFDPLFPLLIP
ncbi:MAG: hypothetical protein M3068_13985 [Gemmatimonadota bacterium]|nr:hypothetical protein [Gemmatimonadota bacterium]